MIVAAAFFISIQGRRHWRGHTADEWFRRIVDGNWNSRDTGESERTGFAALRALDGDALPVLRRALRQKDSALKRALMRLDDRAQFVKLHWIPERRWRQSALRTTENLGTNAAPLIPTLLEVTTHAEPSVRVDAIRALGAVARSADNATCRPTEVGRALVRRLADTNQAVREAAVTALPMFKNEAAEALPAIRRLLGDRATIHAALIALGKLGPNAATSVPDIVGKTDSDNLVTRALAAKALGAIRARPGLSVPALVRLLNDHDTFLRCQAARSLGFFGSAAAEAVPDLSALLDNHHEAIQTTVIEALGNIGPAARPSLPRIVDAWNNNQSALAPCARIALAHIDPAYQP